MVDISAKWKNILTEEAREEVGNVGLPSETVEEIMTTDIPTPGVPQKKGEWGIPKAITNPIELITAPFNLIFGTRQQKAETATSLLPVNIQTKTAELPEEYKVQYEKVEIPDLNITYEKPIFPENVQGGVEQLQPGDIKTTLTTENVEDIVHKQIEEWKAENPEQKAFWETATFGSTNIELPSFDIDILSGIGDVLGSVGKYALIFAVVILGIFIFKR